MSTSNYLQSLQISQIRYLSTNHFALLYLFDVFVKIHRSLVEELSWDITDQVLVEYQSDLQFKQPTNYFIHIYSTDPLPVTSSSQQCNLAITETVFFAWFCFSSHRKAFFFYFFLLPHTYNIYNTYAYIN